MQQIDILRMASGSGGYIDINNIDYSIQYVFARETTVVIRVANSLLLSTDEGATYTTEIPLPPGIGVNDLRLVHVFKTSGNVLIGTHRQCFYTENKRDWFECAYKYADGTVWVRSLQYDNFTPFNGQKPCIIDGKDCLLFSNYNNNENANAQTEPLRSYVWLSNDEGKTMTCLFSLQRTICENTGQLVTARHIHTANWDPYTGNIYCDAGDEVRDINSHWIKGVYNPTTKQFSWNDLGTGHFRKTVGIFFDENFIYGVLDTEKGGLIRYERGKENDTANVVQLLETINDCSGAVFGKNGDVCVHQLRWNAKDTGHVLFYSPDKINWTRIVVNLEDLPAGASIDTVFVRSWQPLVSGKSIVSVQLNFGQLWNSYNLQPTAVLNKILAKYGFPNAFK